MAVAVLSITNSGSVSASTGTSQPVEGIRSVIEDSYLPHLFALHAIQYQLPNSSYQHVLRLTDVSASEAAHQRDFMALKACRTVVSSTAPYVRIRARHLQM